MSAGVLMLFLRHRFCGQIRNLPFDTAPAKLFLFRDAHPLSRTSHLSIGRCGDVGMTAASGRGVRPDAADRGLQLWTPKVLMLSCRGGKAASPKEIDRRGGRTISRFVAQISSGIHTRKVLSDLRNFSSNRQRYSMEKPCSAQTLSQRSRSDGKLI